ncbi:hypothetical protein PENTCL1PPCAC_23534, partial [Pristionchus entomophagus]
VNSEKYLNFKLRFSNDDSIVGRSMWENEGLARAAFVLVEWANNMGGLSKRFGEEQLLSLFVSFGLGAIPGLRRKYIQKPGGDIRAHSKKGEHLLTFIEFISSWEFRVRSSLSFAEIDGGILTRGEWKAFSEASLTSLLSLLTNHRLDLPMSGESGMATKLREYEPRVIQLPDNVINSGLEKVRDALSRLSECKDVKLRKVNSKLVMVSAIGSSEQLRVLSTYIYPPAPSRETVTLRGRIDAMATFTYDRIM